MSKPNFTIRKNQLTAAGCLRSDDLSLALDFIYKRGGFVVIPSDNCYMLAGNAHDSEVYQLIKKILDREEIELSVSVANIQAAEKWVLMPAEVRNLLAKLTPGPITVACPGINEDAKKLARINLMSKDGSIGIRIPDSIIEREIAYNRSADGMLTTVPVKYPEKPRAHVRDFEKACEIVELGMRKLTQKSLFGKRDRHVLWGAVEGDFSCERPSSVVKYFPTEHRIKSLRPGEIDEDLIARLVSPISFQKYGEPS